MGQSKQAGGRPALPPAVERTMGALCSVIEDEMKAAGLADWVEAVYVYGSVALGAYVEQSSDIDFVGIIRTGPTEAHIGALEAAHRRFAAELPNADVMGAYVTRDQLGRGADELGAVPAYFDRRLRSDGTGTDLNGVTWWILKHNGLRVYGTDIPFDYETPVEPLVDEVIRNMNSYWFGWIGRLEAKLVELELVQGGGREELELPADRLDSAIEWCVLGMLRQLYTVKEKGITSKIGAGAYGLQAMPERWHPLIREAVAIKRGEPRPPESSWSSNREKLRELVALLREIHAACNAKQ